LLVVFDLIFIRKESFQTTCRIFLFHWLALVDLSAYITQTQSVILKSRNKTSCSARAGVRQDLTRCCPVGYPHTIWIHQISSDTGLLSTAAYKLASTVSSRGSRLKINRKKYAAQLTLTICYPSVEQRRICVC